MVCDPLSRYDCVPPVAGASCVIVSTADRCPPHRKPVRVRALKQSFNYDNQEGPGLQTGLTKVADDLWAAAGVDPKDIDLAAIYDDYPAMVLAQLNDLKLIPNNDLATFARERIGTREVSGQHVPAACCRPARRALPHERHGRGGATTATLRRRPAGARCPSGNGQRLWNGTVSLWRLRRRRGPGAHARKAGIPLTRCTTATPASIPRGSIARAAATRPGATTRCMRAWSSSRLSWVPRRAKGTGSRATSPASAPSMDR